MTLSAVIRIAVESWLPLVMAATSIKAASSTWPAATYLRSHCQHNLLKRNEGLGWILAPGAHHKQSHQILPKVLMLLLVT